MSEKKPQKRIVSTRRYVQFLGTKLGLNSLVVVSGCAGMLFGLMTAFMVIGASVRSSSEDQFFWRGSSGRLGSIVICLGLTVLTFKCLDLLMKKTNAIQPVEPITDRNAHLLPLQETLIRSSDLPPTEPQAELLRATQAGQETPQEQLLRATTGEE